MRRSKALATAASLCLVLGASACGGQGEQSEEEIVDDISESLRAGDPDLDQEGADCLAELVVDEIGLEEARDIEASAEEPTDEQQLAIAAATIRAGDECDPDEGG